MENSIAYADVGSPPWSSKKVIYNTYQLVFNMGVFAADCWEWNKRAAGKKTLPHLKYLFASACREWLLSIQIKMGAPYRGTQRHRKPRRQLPPPRNSGCHSKLGDSHGEWLCGHRAPHSQHCETHNGAHYGEQEACHRPTGKTCKPQQPWRAWQSCLWTGIWSRRWIRTRSRSKNWSRRPSTDRDSGWSRLEAADPLLLDVRPQM